ncbi:hypothetical protein F8M41_023328 [Gigaspora margarita]|uniref:Uncharacterized protein n=1 Tax=Gigaspora margarita TaxID=4874 RepID=A0A8H4ADK1_GIGMA|nr:hypothetical protein F8M41_023328 [Gigaspora margarita]
MIFKPSRELQVSYFSDISDASNNQDLQEIAFFTKKLQVNQIIHTALPVEYPATSEDGFAAIFNVNCWNNYMDAFNNIQYSINGRGSATTIQDCPYSGNIAVKKDEQHVKELNIVNIVILPILIFHITVLMLIQIFIIKLLLIKK